MLINNLKHPHMRSQGEQSYSSEQKYPQEMSIKTSSRSRSAKEELKFSEQGNSG